MPFRASRPFRSDASTGYPRNGLLGSPKLYVNVLPNCAPRLTVARRGGFDDQPPYLPVRSNVMPYPPRIAILPRPPGFQANPNRGAKLLLSGSWLRSRNCAEALTNRSEILDPEPNTRPFKWPSASVAGGKFSYRKPTLTVKLGVTFQSSWTNSAHSILRKRWLTVVGVPVTGSTRRVICSGLSLAKLRTSLKV